MIACVDYFVAEHYADASPAAPFVAITAIFASNSLGKDGEIEFKAHNSSREYWSIMELGSALRKKPHDSTVRRPD